MEVHLVRLADLVGTLAWIDRTSFYRGRGLDSRYSRGRGHRYYVPVIR